MNYKIRPNANAVLKGQDNFGVGSGVYSIGAGTSDRLKNVWAITFRGQSTSSYYGDIAEKYTINPEDYYPIGTLMEVSDGQYECQSCNDELSSFVIGIVSKYPGFIMNVSLKNSALVALLGTVEVRAIGPVKKKDILVSAGNGCVRSAKSSNEAIYKVAISFETNDDDGEKLIKCFVK